MNFSKENLIRDGNLKYYIYIYIYIYLKIRKLKSFRKNVCRIPIYPQAVCLILTSPYR